MAEKSPTNTLISQRARYNPPSGMLSPTYLADLYRRAWSGNTRAIQRIVDFVNDYSEEAETRLMRLQKNNLNYSSPAVYLETFKSSYDIDRLPNNLSPDDDLGEIIGQAKAVRRFLASPLSRVSNAREYAKIKVDYVLDPNGNINLEKRLGRKLTQRERSYLSKILMSASFTDYLDEHYAQTDEILERVIDEYDFSESTSQNFNRVSTKLATELSSTKLISTLTEQWEVRNTISKRLKGEKE